MERFKRTFSFRKSKKARVPESSKPHQWQEDERKVRDATCSFQVRYLGCIEVFESRGMQVCEEAVKVLKSQCKGRYQRAVLYVSGDALRVVDEISKGLIVDQTIEKVSFCAPDRNHEKGFAYICRDGTTRRWMCHGFLAVKESGERLSHAVGCAFAVCLEKKQKRDKDSGTTDVSVTFNADKTSFTRQGSFRQTTMTERLTDPQSAKIADPVPVNDIFKDALSPVSVARPHASDNMLLRQGSFRGFSKLSQSSPFKRQLSLRLNDLPSTLQRQQGTAAGTEEQLQHQQGTVSPIAEVSPSHEVAQSPRSSEQSQDSISEMCKQLTSGLTALTSDDPFASVPQQQNISMNVAQHSPQPAFAPPIPNNQPIIQGNPWDMTSNAVNNNCPAVNGDFWLKTNQHANTNRTDPFARARGSATNITFNSQRPAMGHGRSHSFDTGEMFMHHQQKRPTLQEIARQDTHNGAMNSTWQGPTATPPGQPGFDPFDAAWASKAANSSLTSNENRNPFNNGATGQMKQFEVKL